MPVNDGLLLGQLTIIELTGADRNKILNNLCTQDLRSLQVGDSKETFVLDPKGRTLAHGTVAALPNATWFITAPNQAERLVPHFDRYIIREDAIVQDVSAHWQASLLPADSPWLASPDASWIDNNLRCQQNEINHSVLVTTPWIGSNSKLLFQISTDNQATQFASSDCTLRKDWEYDRIRNFWPWFGTDFDDKNLPQELDIDSRTISFKKGCYLGQETVARLDALGQVQKKLCKIEVIVPLESPASCDSLRGLELLSEDKSVGTICSIAQAPNSPCQCIGLAMLKRSAFSTDAMLRLNEYPTTTIRRIS